ncbi:MAG: hypothetical protein K2X27_08435, partial [Candidatus Obscuribacterales bacterium]|nr:hypothetical protein [Candidatus Obscuribacterales bacterium]
NQGFTNRLKQSGMPEAALNLYLSNGQKDPNWHKQDADAAKKLEALYKNPQKTQQAIPSEKSPFAPVSPFAPSTSPFGSNKQFLPKIPVELEKHLKKSPF